MYKGKKTKLMKKIFINNLLITLTFFLLLEILIRGAGLVQLKGHGKELIEKKNNIETTVFGKKVYLDKYGYRVPYKDFLYKNNKIIFLGDSVLFGSGVIEEKTVVGRLREFNKKNSYINASIIGNDITENLKDIKKNYLLFNNNTFYIFFTLDDILSRSIENPKSNKINKKVNFFNNLKQNYILKKINNFLRTKSYTYLWIKGLTTNPSERYFFESYNNYQDDAKINFFSTQIDKINNLKSLNNLNLKIIILPFEFQTRNGCNSNLLLPQNKLVKIFKNKNIQYINLTDNFCSHPKPKELFLKFDPVHLSEAGHEFVFNLIKNKIN